MIISNLAHFSHWWQGTLELQKTKTNSVQKLCGAGFSQFLLLCFILGPTSLWESYSCWPPLISPAGSVRVWASGKAQISWETSWNWEIRRQTKTIWHVWNALHGRIWKWQYFIIIFGSGYSNWREIRGNYKEWLHTVYLENYTLILRFTRQR